MRAYDPLLKSLGSWQKGTSMAMTYMEPDGTLKTTPLARCDNCGELVAGPVQLAGTEPRRAPDQPQGLIARIGVWLNAQRPAAANYPDVGDHACPGL